MDELLLKKDDFIRKIFDAIPSILLLADDDVRILRLNAAAAGLLGVGIGDIHHQRGGEILHCIHATEVPEGCGYSENCKECVIRNSVKQSVSGATVYRQKTKMELVKNDGKITGKHFLVTTSPFEYGNKTYALLILEDISELEQLKGMIQICASCKKIRNDKGFWEQIELFIRERSEVEFTHGICPECTRKLYPEYCDAKAGEGTETCIKSPEGVGTKEVQCWEYMKCGHEVDKSCPVVLMNAGRMCWDISSTLCGGKKQGESFTKFRLCKDCEFFIKLNRGEI